MPQDPFAALPVVRKPKPGIFSDVTGGASSSTDSDDPFAHLPSVRIVSPRGASLAPLASGMTLGASDEILGGLEGVNNALPKWLGGGGGTFSEGYERGKQKVRAVGADYAREHPNASTALELGGSLVAPVGAAKFIKAPASLLAKVGRSALVGSAVGGTAGAASATEGERIGGAITGAEVGGVVGGAIPAIGGTASRTANALGLRSAKAAARIGPQKVVEALREEGLSPEAIKQAAADAVSSGTPARLLDLGKPGGSVARLARAAQAVPGEHSNQIAEALHGRQATQMGRVFGHVEDAAGVKGRDLHEVQQEINKRASDAARPFYESAYAHGAVDLPAELVERPAIKKALASGRKLAADEGIKLPDDVTDVRTIDYAKRSLDDRISALLRKGKKDQARILQGARRDLLNVADKASPDFKQARSLFAGEKAHETALLKGSRVFGKPRANEPPIDKWLAKASDAEKESFKLGAIGRIRDILESTADNRDKVAKLVSTPKQRRVLQEIVGDAGKNSELGKILAGETRLVQNKNFILGNSQTARILADVDNMSNTALSALMDVASGNIVGAGKKVLGAGLKGRAKAGGGKIAAATAKALLLKPGTPEFQKFVEGLPGAEPSYPMRKIAIRRLSEPIGQQYHRPRLVK